MRVINFSRFGGCRSTVIAVMALFALLATAPAFNEACAAQAQAPPPAPSPAPTDAPLPAPPAQPAVAPQASPAPQDAPQTVGQPGPPTSTDPIGGTGPVKLPDKPSISQAEYTPIVQTTLAALEKDTFTFQPNKVLDPFVPFIAPADVAAQQLQMAESEDEAQAPEMLKPLTPLQKMTLVELERGLKAITWGEYGRRAVIEDSAGKGYIVTVGTPAGEKNGVVAQIFNDRLVIQQQYWDKKTKKMIPQDFVVKLIRTETSAGPARRRK